MAMFVLVVDTSLMNVSISAVVRDLDATASGVQSAIALEALVSAAAPAQARGQAGADRRRPVRIEVLPPRYLVPDAAADRPRRADDLPAEVLEYNALEAGLSLAPLSLTMFAVALLAGRKAGGRSPSRFILVRFVLLAAGVAVLIPIVPRADSGWAMALPLVIAGAGLGLLVSQLNNYTLAPIEEERVSEAAGVNSAGGSFGLSFGLAFAGAIMLASLAVSFTQEADSSEVL
jgi:MFS family permease